MYVLLLLHAGNWVYIPSNKGSILSACWWNWLTGRKPDYILGIYIDPMNFLGKLHPYCEFPRMTAATACRESSPIQLCKNGILLEAEIVALGRIEEYQVKMRTSFSHKKADIGIRLGSQMEPSSVGRLNPRLVSIRRSRDLSENFCHKCPCWI